MNGPVTPPQPIAERYSVIDFFGPLNGAGWYSPELGNGLTFRWSAEQAELVVPLLRGAFARFILYVAHFSTPGAIETLRIHLDDRELEWSCDLRQGGAVVHFDQPELSNFRFGRLVFEIDTVREPGGGRVLGLAVNRLDIVYHQQRMPSPRLYADGRRDADELGSDMR